jgi:hypothetical protein
MWEKKNMFRSGGLLILAEIITHVHLLHFNWTGPNSASMMDGGRWLCCLRHATWKSCLSCYFTEETPETWSGGGTSIRVNRFGGSNQPFSEINTVSSSVLLGQYGSWSMFESACTVNLSWHVDEVRQGIWIGQMKEEAQVGATSRMVSFA